MVDKTDLAKLVPLDSLSEENFNDLVKNSSVEKYPAGTVLFKQGDMDRYAIYVLEGTVVLSSNESTMERTVEGGTEEGLYAITQLKPRQNTGTARSDVLLFKVDSDQLDRLLTWDQVTGISVIEMEEDQNNEWMMAMLKADAFKKLPAENINEMFNRMEVMEVKKGDVIVRQGEPGDYYYVIQEGQCDVSRTTKQGKVVSLNRLGTGQQFGEEALVSDAPRNATITMLSDGLLLRLAKNDFLELVRAPMVQWLTFGEAQQMVKQGAGLLDVRTESEYRQGAIKGAQSLPLYKLRELTDRLDPAKKYIIYCQTGVRSGVAAFLLSQRGITAYALKGGLQALKKT
jgi:CRP-like cAMP-binding protein